VLPQIAPQVLALDPTNIRCKPRAWKVMLVGEGADDAGGVFDETIAQMCEVSETLMHRLIGKSFGHFCRNVFMQTFLLIKT